MRNVIVLLVLSMFANFATADDSMRCGSSLVSSSSTVSELLAKCGEPHSKVTTVEDVHARGVLGGTNVVGTTTIEKWTYERGAQRFAVIVTIIDGRVTSLESRAK